MAHESGIRKVGISPLFGPEMLADPYPVYRRLRETDPVHWHEPFQAWLLTRYDDIVAVEHDLRFSSARIAAVQAAANREDLAGFFNFISKRMLFNDPPVHTRLRGVVAQAFKPHVIAGLRAHIQSVVDGLLDRVQGRGEMDAIADFAYPLPATIIMELLGVPPEDRDRVKEWSDEYVLYLSTDPHALTPEQYTRAAAGSKQLYEYFQTAVARHRAAPRDDLLSVMVHAEEQGHRLSEEEVLANAHSLMVAGHESATNMIGNGLLALLRHPDQFQKLRDNLALVPTALEEFLRFDSPVQFMARVAKEDVALGGRTIRQGQSVELVYGAANRDPAHFPDPDRLDITRSPNKHLAFGQGPHFCIGAQLARLEGEVAFATLLRRFPKMQLAATTVAHRDNFNLRGPKALPVRF